jgi:hypothetical protein
MAAGACAGCLQVAVRARELDTLKLQLGKLMAGLEAQAAADKEVLAAQTARLARESARLEALQVCVLLCIHIGRQGAAC